MPDTRRSQSALATLFADNTAGDISAQDGRDLILSVHPEKTCQTGTYASEPSSGQLTGDLYLPSDSFYAERYSGSAWTPWGPIFPLTKPVDADFSWVNQGTASVVTTNGGLVLLPATGAGAHSLNMRVKTAPSTPYTVTVALLATTLYTGNGMVGLLFRESSTGKLHIFSIVPTTSAITLASYSFHSHTTWAGTYRQTEVLPLQTWFLRLADNGTNRILSFSADGRNFVTFHSVSRTDFITADQVGFYGNPYVSGADQVVTVLSWKEA